MNNIMKKGAVRELPFRATLIFTLIVIAIAGVPLLVQFNDNEEELKIYFADNITNTKQKIIENFNNKNQGRIEVVPINLPFNKFTTNERKEILIRSFRSKSEKIDLFTVDHIWVHRFAKWAELLDVYYTSNQIKSYLDEAIVSCYFDSNLVSIPFKIDIATMYCKEELLINNQVLHKEKDKLNASITWSEFIKLGRKFKNDSYPFYIFQALNYEGLVCSFFEAILNLNRDYFKYRPVYFNKPESQKALQLFYNLVNVNNISPEEVVQFNEIASLDYYNNNDGIFLRFWPQIETENRDYFNADNQSNKMIRLPLPHFEGTEPASIFGGWNIMISKFSTKKMAALEFIRYLTSEEVQKILYTEEGQLPVLKKIYSDDYDVIGKEKLLFYKKLFATGVHRPFAEDYTRISEIVSFYVSRAINNEISLDECLRSIDEMIVSKQVILK